MLISPVYQVDTNNELLEGYARPLEEITFFAWVLAALVMLNGVLVLTTTTALFVKNRQIEIGSFLALGMRKRTILLQFYCELAMEMVVGFSIALLLSSFIINPLGQRNLDLSVIEEQARTSVNPSEFDERDRYFTEATQQVVLDEFKIKLEFPVIVGTFVYGVSVLLLSLAVTAGVIMRFNPK